MARTKNYKAKASGTATDLAAGLGATDALVELPPNPRNQNLIDLRPWLGRGFDDWIWAVTTVLKARLHSGNYSVATIVSFAANGIKVFLPYLTGSHVDTMPSRPADMGHGDVARYITWLRLKYPKGSTAKNYYSAFKSVVIGLMDYGFIDQTPEVLLPANPFPMNAKVTRGETSLSQAEMQKLATALKVDLIAIHHGRFVGLESEAIVALMLIIGMRSGINTTPLLEMKRDCLGPHPFMPNLMLVKTFKRRGKGAQSTSLRQTHVHDRAATIPMDGVAVLKKALALTELMVPDAPEAIKDRVWLYRSSQRGKAKGKVLCLNVGSVSELTRAIVQRHGLVADDDSPLRVTPGRLRKTMENRLWQLSDGDLLAVSVVMGHSPQVADNHYLRLDEHTKLKARNSLVKRCQLSSGGKTSCQHLRVVAKTACKARSPLKTAPHIARNSRIAWGVQAMPLWGRSRTCTGCLASSASYCRRWTTTPKESGMSGKATIKISLRKSTELQSITSSQKWWSKPRRWPKKTHIPSGRYACASLN